MPTKTTRTTQGTRKRAGLAHYRRTPKPRPPFSVTADGQRVWRVRWTHRRWDSGAALSTLDLPMCGTAKIVTDASGHRTLYVGGVRIAAAPGLSVRALRTLALARLGLLPDGRERDSFRRFFDLKIFG